MRILAKGANVTVWRGEGDDGPMEEVLSSSAVPTLTTVSMWFISGANAAFAYDDVEIVADGWTSGTTFVPNSGNEVTSSTFGGVTTTYGYDAWGRMTSKARGSYSATYGWHYGGKLTKVDSDFPSEGTVAYAYGGDQKRRERDDGTTLSYKWAEGYQAHSEQIGSDASTRRTYIGGLAHFDTATASDGTYRYYGADHLGSTRTLWESDRDLASAYEYGPYGTAYAGFGPGTRYRETRVRTRCACAGRFVHTGDCQRRTNAKRRGTPPKREEAWGCHGSQRLLRRRGRLSAMTRGGHGTGRVTPT